MSLLCSMDIYTIHSVEHSDNCLVIQENATSLWSTFRECVMSFFHLISVFHIYCTEWTDESKLQERWNRTDAPRDLKRTQDKGISSRFPCCQWAPVQLYLLLLFWGEFRTWHLMPIEKMMGGAFCTFAVPIKALTKCLWVGNLGI